MGTLKVLHVTLSLKEMGGVLGQTEPPCPNVGRSYPFFVSSPGHKRQTVVLICSGRTTGGEGVTRAEKADIDKNGGWTITTSTHIISYTVLNST